MKNFDALGYNYLQSWTFLESCDIYLYSMSHIEIGIIIILISIRDSITIVKLYKL